MEKLRRDNSAVEEIKEKLMQEMALREKLLQEDTLLQERCKHTELMSEVRQMQLKARQQQRSTRQQRIIIDHDFGPESEPDNRRARTRNINFDPEVIHVRRPNMVTFDRDSPLLEGLQRAPYPQQFKMGTIQEYRGAKDRRQFLISYEATITSAAGDEVTLAKVFASTLG